MKTTNITRFFLLFIFTTSFISYSQDQNYTCDNAVYETLSKKIGVWHVKTKDRISPGVYETNNGISNITSLINGCSIRESFRGNYKNKKYAREVFITGKDSTSVQMSVLDSEHNKFSILNGNLKDNQIIVYWFRNNERKKLQSKYILTTQNLDEFEFSSYLSTDYGKNWALTHQRIYNRKN